jgi:phytoene desaturase
LFILPKKLFVIGSGFAGMSAASFMARAGWDVTVLEKHDLPGGRARQLKTEGFAFDMGPSWYWMPDVFERYFVQFGKQVSDYYTLKRLDPSYRIYEADRYLDIPASFEGIKKLFEELEPGSSQALDKFMSGAAFKYRTGMQKLVFKPGQSYLEFLDLDIIKGLFQLDVFTSIKRHIGKYFTHPLIRKMLEFPSLFLGALPENTPALYSLMNYADIQGGTWYPQGGIYSVVDAIYQVAVDQGVKFLFGQEVIHITSDGYKAKEIITRDNSYAADVIIGAADYHYIESCLLPKADRSYPDTYWSKRKMAPSCLLYYVGLNKKLHNVLHHSLFFDSPFDQHARQLYQFPQWPTDPLFYVSTPSVTDETVAPAGCENLFLLIPVAAGLQGDTQEIRDRYFSTIMHRIEKLWGQSVSAAVLFNQSFGPSDFISEYHAFKGNAYGLANTLDQTATGKPSCRSKMLKNLFYTGQLTVPGPGVPPALISGEVVAGEVLKCF